MKIENAVDLVTGANRGIGLAFVRELLARGARKVYAAARDRLAEAVAELNAATAALHRAGAVANREIAREVRASRVMHEVSVKSF